MRTSRWSLAVVILLTWLIQPCTALCQEPIESAQDLLRRAALARYEIMQFAARVDVAGPLATIETCFPLLPNAKHVGLDLEYSRIGQHFVTTAQIGPGLSGFIGRTDNLRLEGESSAGIFVTRSVGQDFGNRHSNELVVFDPRVVGLVDSKQLASGISFESAMSPLLRSDLSKAKLSTRGGLFTIQWPDHPLNITIDTHRGYWPVRYELDDRENGRRDQWEIRLAKSHARYLPESATFKSEVRMNDKRSVKNEIEFKFTWRIVNGFLSTGDKGIQRIANAHRTEVIKQEAP